MMVKRLMSLLLTIAILSTMAVTSAVAATDSSASTGVAFANQDKYADQVYNGEDLGCTYTPEATTWKVWSPAAEKVQLKLYKTGTDRENGAGVIGTYDLTKDASFASNGVWAVTLEGDFKNVYYTYLVTAANTNGDVVTNETQDIYSQAVGANGDRSMVVDLDDTDPEGWDDDKHVVYDNMSQTAVWELHIRDFSCDPESGISKENQGNYLAFTEGGTTLQSDTTAESITTGIDYLVEQGINCVQLMPFADYDQIDEIYGDSATTRNWGYNPKNYNVPDGAYSSDAYDGNVRINEVKQMIQALHDRGISVVMDVVYNHTAGYEASCFTKTVPGYYYRMMSATQYADGSGQGCELASENAMTRNYIIQSLKYWTEEYHIDGYRFDLMACIDVETLNQAREMLNNLYADGTGEKILMYGEPWAGGTSLCSVPAVPSNASKMAKGVGMFEANMRDASSNVTKKQGGAWLLGTLDSAASTIVTGIKADHVNSTYNNTQTVNYPECHDNFALWDKIVGAYTKSGEGKASETVYDNVNSTDEAYTDRLKLAGALFLTSQGITFMQSGTEFARTKKGTANSYNSSDEINQLDWSRIIEYKDVVEYYRGLNKINDVYSPFNDDTETSEDTINVLRSDSVIAYTIDNVTANAANEWGKVAVLLNSGNSDQTIDLGASGWVVVANGTEAGVKNLGTVDGSSYTVEARSAAVLVEKNSYKDFSDNYKFGKLTTNHYVDGTLKKTTTATYKIGTNYHALQDAEILVDNKLEKAEGTTSGQFTGDTTVDYYYVSNGKNLGTLTVNYVDRDGFTVTPSMTYLLEAGDAYQIPVCSVEGYQLNTKKYPANTTGVFSGEDKEITFIYKELDSQVVTMHYYNTNSNWKNVLCYAYTDNGEQPLGAWQASSTNKTARMEPDPEMGDNWFKIDIPVASCKVMFYSTAGSLGQEPGQNEPGYAVAGECWVENKVVTYNSTIVTSYIDVGTGRKVGYDVTVTEKKKNTDYYTTSTDGIAGTLYATPANAEGFYQPGVINVVYLYEEGTGTTIPMEPDDDTSNEDRYILGDANCDGMLNINDVTYIQQYLVNLVNFDFYNVRNADVDGNYKVTIKDASFVQRCLVGLDVDYMIGHYYDSADYQVPTEPEDDGEELMTLLFSDASGWASKGALYCYYWTEEAGENAAWPGQEMELSGTNEYGQNQYSIDLPLGANFVITNNYVQTVDLVFNGQNGFYPTGIVDGKYECESW